MFQNFTSYLFIILFHLNFRKMLKRSNDFYFYEWKTQKLRDAKYVTRDYTANKLANKDLDPLIQVFLVPKPMLITVILKNGTNLILYLK